MSSRRRPRNLARNGVGEAHNGTGFGVAGHDSSTGAAPFLKLGSGS